MAIWIVTSSLSDLYLLRVLREYNFPFHVRYDQEGWDWGDKEESYVSARIEQGLRYLIDTGVTQIILPPIWELRYRNHSTYCSYVMPLFYHYMTMSCLPNSRIWKLGLLGEYSDCTQQEIIANICAGHTLTQVQSATKLFHQPIALRSCQVNMWKHFLVTLGFRNWMMHNVVKQDLHYLLDAWVDTIIPLQYGYFAYEATIAKLFRTKKCTLHRGDVIAQVFASCLGDAVAQWYAVTVSYTGTNAHLLAEKKWLRIIQRGKEVEVSWVKV